MAKLGHICQVLASNFELVGKDQLSKALKSVDFSILSKGTKKPSKYGLFFFVDLAFLMDMPKPLPIEFGIDHILESWSKTSVLSLLLGLRSIDIGGAQEKEGHFHYKNFLRALK